MTVETNASATDAATTAATTDATAAGATDAATVAATATTDAATVAATATTDAAAAGANDAAATTSPAATPAEYAFTTPKGVTLDGAVIGDFKAAAKDIGLSQEHAQQLIDKLAPTIAKQNSATLNKMLAEADATWQEQSKSDKEFGGENFDKNLAVAKKALDAYGTPELSQLLESSRLGQHPEVIRWMYRVGQTVRPDTFVNADGGAANKTVAQLFYPNSDHN